MMPLYSPPLSLTMAILAAIRFVPSQGVSLLKMQGGSNLVSVPESEGRICKGRYHRESGLERTGTPQDLAGTVVFLASEASDYVTGEMIFVDGGMKAGYDLWRH